MLILHWPILPYVTVSVGEFALIHLLFLVSHWFVLQMPEDPLFSPNLRLTVYDSSMGGLFAEMVTSCLDHGYTFIADVTIQ